MEINQNTKKCWRKDTANTSIEARAAAVSLSSPQQCSEIENLSQGAVFLIRFLNLGNKVIWVGWPKSTPRNDSIRRQQSQHKTIVLFNKYTISIKRIVKRFNRAKSLRIICCSRVGWVVMYIEIVHKLQKNFLYLPSVYYKYLLGLHVGFYSHSVFAIRNM